MGPCSKELPMSDFPRGGNSKRRRLYVQISSELSSLLKMSWKRSILRWHLRQEKEMAVSAFFRGSSRPRRQLRWEAGSLKESGDLQMEKGVVDED